MLDRKYVRLAIAVVALTLIPDPSVAAKPSKATNTPTPTPEGGGVEPTNTPTNTPQSFGPYDWPMYQHDIGRTGRAETELTATTVKDLQQEWFFNTDNEVSAQPIRVGDTVYVGAWDGCFYALNAATGAKRWHFAIDLDQRRINPQPSGTGCPRSVDYNGQLGVGGYITSTAAFAPAQGGHPDLVIFGGGFTLYALKASDGTLYWKRKFPRVGEIPKGGTSNDPDDITMIQSSPAVYNGRVYFMTDYEDDLDIATGHGATDGYHAQAIAVNLDGTTAWKRDLNLDEKGNLRHFNCGGSWSSPTIIPSQNVMVFGTANCTPHIYYRGVNDERVLALSLTNGSVVWKFSPATPPKCDFDIGSTAVYDAAANFLGIGRKDGTFFRLNPSDGKLIWSKRVIHGGWAGGFQGGVAFDGSRVYGATGVGDNSVYFGPCDPDDAGYKKVQDPSMHAINISNGSVAWTANQAYSFGAVSTASGMTFHSRLNFPPDTTVTPQIQIRNASNGTVLKTITVPGAIFGVAPPRSASCCVISQNAIFFGTGVYEVNMLGQRRTGVNLGVYAFTPNSVAVK